MRCTKCEGDTKVLETRDEGDCLRRRRMCIACGNRITTWEITTRPILIARDREKRRLAAKRRWDAKTPEERRRLKKREKTRVRAREEAAETGTPVKALYEKWEVL